ncbi:MAG: DNA repair protein RadC [Dehalococcoidia bacterium]
MTDEPRAYRSMHDWAGDERPRERLLEHGADTLSDAELLAIILRSGIAGENVVDLSRNLLDQFGGLDGMLRAGPNALQRAKGLGPAKAAQVSAAIELGRRAQALSPTERPDLRTPEKVFNLLGPRLVGARREELYCLALDTRGRLLGGLNPVVSGSANVISLRPAEVFREAIILDAPSVILVHNHPSGDPRPSPQDISTTKAFIAAGKILDLEVEDHVVIGTNSWVSMRREKMGFA